VEEAGPACGWLHCFELQAPPAEFDSLAALLSDGERARAARFHFADHAARFTVAHGRLRQWLAPLLGIAPERVAFTAGPHGKPALAGEAADSGIQFNLSHSDTLGLVGWCVQLRFDPSATPFGEASRFGHGASARDRHACRSVRTEPQNITSRAGIADQH
jgi:hypothetical protein